MGREARQAAGNIGVPSVVSPGYPTPVGAVAEWPNAAVLRTAGETHVGSNPTRSVEAAAKPALEYVTTDSGNRVTTR